MKTISGTMTGPVRSISQALAVLRLLAGTAPLTLSDICRAVGLSPSSCLNILKTLAAEGVVEREAVGKRYRLTPDWAGVAALRGVEGAALLSRAAPVMARFADMSDAAVGLWKIVSRDRMQLAMHAESRAGMRLRLAEDQRQPLGGGAAGRAIAAGEAVDDHELARRFRPVRWQTPLDFDQYRREVAEARVRGFAVDEGFAHRGVCTVAVGIAEASPGFCLSASIVAGSRTTDEIDALGRDLVDLKAALLS